MTLSSNLFLVRSFILFTIFICAESQSQCFVGCSDGSVGFRTIDDLNCAMLEESQQVPSLRSPPPYRYRLCPNTNFTGTLLPQLNSTEIFCDDDPNRPCRFVDGAEIDLSQIGVVSLTFRHLRFIGGTSATPTVIAAGPAAALAVFENCHWRNRVFAVDHSGPMQLRIVDSTLKDTDTDERGGTPLTKGIQSYGGGTLELTNVVVENYNVSQFLDARNGAQVTIANSRFENNVIKHPEGFNDFLLFTGNTDLLFRGSVVGQNNMSNFIWQQQGASVQILSSDFYNNQGITPTTIVRATGSSGDLLIRDSYLEGKSFALVTISGFGPQVSIENSIFMTEKRSNHAIYSFTTTSIVNTCFQGITMYPPIFISGGESNIQLSNVFSDATITDSNCSQGLFIEEESDNCFYPDESSVRSCLGQCVALDGAGCRNSRDPPTPTCNLDRECPEFPNIVNCSPDLQTLRCNMCLEAQAVLTGGALRDPPYVYKLCPQTTYTIQNETLEAIFPVLNNTIIACGDTGSRTENCFIEGGYLQMEIGKKSRDPFSFDSPRPLEYLEVYGLTFLNSQRDPRSPLSPSVWARSDASTNARMIDCHWFGSAGTHVVLNANRDDFGVALPGMTMTFQFCSLDQAAEADVGIQAIQAKVNLIGCSVRTNRYRLQFGQISQSIFSVQDSTLNDNVIGMDGFTSPFFNIGDGTTMRLTNSRVRRNSFAEFMKMVSSAQFIVETTSFRNNTGNTVIDCQKSATTQPSRVTIDRSRFEDSRMTSMIFSDFCDVSIDITLFANLESSYSIGSVGRSSLQLSNSCFLGGNYFYPIYFSGNTGLQMQNVHSQNMSTAVQCEGIVTEPSGTKACLDDPLVCINTGCQPFDAPVCALGTAGPPLTPPPTPAPQLPTSLPPQPTFPPFPTFFEPTVSQQPSLSSSPSQSDGTRKALGIMTLLSILSVVCVTFTGV